MSLVALDTNVMIGLLSSSDVLHDASKGAVERWVDQRAGLVISTVTWCEVLTGVLRQGKLSEAAFREHVERVTEMIAPVDVAIASTAASFRARDRSLLTPDALIVATAKHVGADALLTADRRLKRVDPDLVQVICP